MLSDRDLIAQLSAGRIVLDPLPPEERFQPVSVDVTLGPLIRSFEMSRGRIVPIGDIPDDLTVVWTFPSGGLELRPRQFILGTTAERLTLPDDVAARLEGKSTNGRLGLLVHATAGLIDPGFSGHITLEITNVSEMVLLLRPGDLIGQLTFEATSSPCVRPYGSPGLRSHYQHQRGPVAPVGSRL